MATKEANSNGEVSASSSSSAKEIFQKYK